MSLSDFHFDGIAAVYLLIGITMTFLTLYHGVEGNERPTRFYYAILAFCVGYVVTVMSGNLKVLFVGWELIGISSFLLIILHSKPTTRNTLKALLIYRIGDVGLLLAMWASHHLWREHTTLFSLLLLLTASAQSSQLPFSSWLPQAMEGSNTAGNIILTTLMVQMGILLLLRTMPVWEHQLVIRMLIAFLGVIAATMAAGFARVQSSAKRRIAYASMAHTGLIFIEVAAGLKALALIHVAANAFLRAYQLTAKPSLARPGARKEPDPGTAVAWEERLPKRLQYTLYMYYLKEWGLYSRLAKYLRT